MYSINNLFSISKQSIIVTGAAGQLGSEIVNLLSDLGARVTASDINLDDLNLKAQKNSWNSKEILLHQCDISIKDEVKNLINASDKKFGEISSFIANAGVSVFEPFLDRPETSIDHVMSVNLKGSILCMQQFVKYRQDKIDKKSSIVLIGSHYGQVSPDPRIYTDLNRRNSEVYGATKAGIIQLAKYYAVHGSEFNIRANVVSPGGILNEESPQGPDFQKNYSSRCPMGRMAIKEDIMGAILFLISPSSNFITGQNISVDGGFTSW